MRNLLVLLIVVAGCATPPELSFVRRMPVQVPTVAPVVPVAPVAPVAPAMLVFTAQWCPACQAAKPYIEQLIEKGVNVTVVNCDERSDLVSQYNVTSIPLFIYGDERTNDPAVALSWFE